LRSESSVGVIVRGLEYAESKIGFIYKYSVTQKEVNQTQYWLELLYQTEFIDDKMFNLLNNDITETQKIITDSIIGTKINLKK
jgi:four helix bundle protein